MASNHVGHFIYSLRERSWPDFQLVFKLFRGDPNSPIFKDPSLCSGFNPINSKKISPHENYVDLPILNSNSVSSEALIGAKIVLGSLSFTRDRKSVV